MEEVQRATAETDECNGAIGLDVVFLQEGEAFHQPERLSDLNWGHKYSRLYGNC